MSQALATVDIPPVHLRPKGVTTKQWRLAALLPRAESAYQALVAAGFSPGTARSSALRQRESAGVAIATKAQEALRTDSARQIKAKAAAHVGRHVSKDALDIQDALNVWATSAKIAGDYPDEENDGLSPQDRSAAREMIRRYCRIAARVAVYRATRPQHVVLSPGATVLANEK